MDKFDQNSDRLKLIMDLQSIDAVTDDKQLLKHILIDILNLRNEMEDNLLLMNKHIMRTETNIDLINILSTAQYHIDRINTIYKLGESWLKDGPHSALISIKVDGLLPPKVVNDAKIEPEEGDADAESENGTDDVKKTAAVETSQVLDQNLVEKEKKSVDQCHHHNSSFKINVTGDNKATKSIKQKSRTTYERAWMRFRNHFKCSDEFESRMPTEEEFLSYFGFLRKEKQHSSSSLWTIFSMLNSVCKGKYEIPLQTYPRLRCIIKSYDVDIKKKAYTFTNEEIAEFVQNESLSGAYWLVRKAIVILTYFGGLRHAEVMSLTLENICCDPEGLNIFHQRGNKKASFCVPKASTESDIDWASYVEVYLRRLKDDLGKFTGRVFWTGRGNGFVNQPFGKNMVTEISHEVAKILGKPNKSDFTFNSFRRSSTSTTPDSRTLSPQFQENLDYSVDSNMMKNEDSRSLEQMETDEDMVKSENIKVEIEEIEDTSSIEPSDILDQELIEEEEEEEEKKPVECCPRHNSNASMNIIGDKEVTESIKQKSRLLYGKAWIRFRNHFKCSDEFESRMPTEEEFLSYFGFLRKEKQHSSSSLWTIFSMLNSVCKGKYGIPLQTYPRLRSIIKSYDVDVRKKAQIFTNEEIAEFVSNESLSGPYWLVRKALVVLTYFGGLRHAEVMNLSLENIISDPEGILVIYQRGNQQASFRVPKAWIDTEIDWASYVEVYLRRLKDDLGKFTGRVFWTGRGKGFVNLPFGKNMVNELSHEIAKILGKPNQSDFTFHSFRRSSTVASFDTGTSGLLCHGTGKAGRSNSLDTDIKLEADPLQIESTI